jgi:hypothetical protein
MAEQNRIVTIGTERKEEEEAEWEWMRLGEETDRQTQQEMERRGDSGLV